MQLKNLNELAELSQKDFESYNQEEIILSEDFKKLYAEKYHSDQKSKIFFSRYTTIVESNSGLTITFPNQWFYIASHFVDFFIALNQYKSAYLEIFNDQTHLGDLTKKWKKEKTVGEDIRNKISDYFDDEVDQRNFELFLTDYQWWYGSKTIDRTDYFVSPILSLAKVVNVTQTYIADITEKLEDNTIHEALKKSRKSSIRPKVEKGKVEKFILSAFSNAVKDAGLKYDDQLLTRFVSSLATKPFVILTGLSGSGKTKLAQAFVQWISETEEQFCIIPVGSDWTNREPLLGYQNSLIPNEYVLPENRLLETLIQATKNPDKPYFVILDEMNLSHVERYFADFLSAMESKGKIPLHSSDEPMSTADNNINVPSEIAIPSNFFLIGTVNIDETTYMFSPKVLDRANTIEFRISTVDLQDYLADLKPLQMSNLNSLGANLASGFLNLPDEADTVLLDTDTITKELVSIFEILKFYGFEFGYRSASEIILLMKNLYLVNGLDSTQQIDIAIIQKILPKIHGSGRSLGTFLEALAELCTRRSKPESISNFLLNYDSSQTEISVSYPLSLNKISRMYRSATQNGYASFAEA